MAPSLVVIYHLQDFLWASVFKLMLFECNSIFWGKNLMVDFLCAVVGVVVDE